MAKRDRAVFALALGAGFGWLFLPLENAKALDLIRFS